MRARKQQSASTSTRTKGGGARMLKKARGGHAVQRKRRTHARACESVGLKRQFSPEFGFKPRAKMTNHQVAGGIITQWNTVEDGGGRMQKSIKSENMMCGCLSGRKYDLNPRKVILASCF